MNNTRPTLTQRLHQTTRLLRSEGANGVVSRLRTRAARAIVPTAYSLPVSAAEFDRAGSLAASGWKLPGAPAWTNGQPMSVGWLCTPPSAGSGGHTTIFRMAQALVRSGHDCVIYVHDEHGWSLDQHKATIERWWPWMRAEVRDAAAGLDDHHAIFATSWTTAWTLLQHDAAGARCYFVQDFEAAFYPAGSEYLLAEATYTFPYHMVTAGRWLAEHLTRSYGADARHFDFGSDLNNYRYADSESGRAAICYYCRPETPRRAHELAIASLAMFAGQHPEVPIYSFGQNPGDVPFRIIDKGLLSPAELNTLYGACRAGLVLSATNSSLVPHEMLAAGCIPVVNDAEHNRIVLDNDNVAYCRPMPHEIAGELARLIELDDASAERQAELASASVPDSGWGRGEAQFVDATEQIVRADQVS